VITLSGAARGSKWRHAPRSASGFEGASTHFIQTFKKRVFSKNLGQNTTKNAYFLEKRLENGRSALGRPPRTPGS